MELKPSCLLLLHLIDLRQQQESDSSSLFFHFDCVKMIIVLFKKNHACYNRVCFPSDDDGSCLYLKLISVLTGDVLRGHHLCCYHDYPCTKSEGLKKSLLTFSRIDEAENDFFHFCVFHWYEIENAEEWKSEIVIFYFFNLIFSLTY